MTLIIKNWSKHYEKSDHKKCKDMKWIAVPIKFDGKGYRRIMKMKDGPLIMGAWMVLLQLAAKQPERGVLADGDGDLSFGDMELLTDFPSKTLEKAASVLSSEIIGWIQDTCGKIPQPSGNPPTTLHNKTRQDKTEQDITASRPFKEIIDYLNLKAGTNYQDKSADTKRRINARFEEGATLDHFKQVIDIKVPKWIDDCKMKDFLRPATLFSKKFWDYYGEIPSMTEQEKKDEADDNAQKKMGLGKYAAK